MSREDNGFKMVISGAAFGACFTIVAVMLFAFALSVAPLSDTVIKVVNAFIKIFSVLTACLFFLKGRLGYLKGGCVGALVFALTYAIFAMFAGAEVFGLGFFTDLLFGVVVGVISGITAVNFKKSA